MINKKHIPLFFLPLLLIPILNASAINVTIDGTLDNGNGSPFLAKIQLVRSSDTSVVLFTETDATGFYSISIPQGTWEITLTDGQTNQTDTSPQPRYFDLKTTRTFNISDTINVSIPVRQFTGKVTVDGTTPLPDVFLDSGIGSISFSVWSV